MTFSIRMAGKADVPAILRFITDLAIYEKAEHEVKATVESLETTLFGPDSVTETAILEKDGTAMGFAVWFYSYSTWLARNGLYLEDLYVDPAHRGSGGGKMLLKFLARRAVERIVAVLNGACWIGTNPPFVSMIRLVASRKRSGFAIDSPATS